LILTDYRPRLCLFKIAGNGTSKKGVFQNGTENNYTKRTEGNGEGEESQCAACPNPLESGDEQELILS